MARLKSCKYCGRIHGSDILCPAAPRREKEPTEISKLRSCRRWGKTRNAAYERDHHLCRLCLRDGFLNSEQLEAHHIVPLREDPDRAYDLDNVATLCARHHKEAEAGQVPRDLLAAMAQEGEL